MVSIIAVLIFLSCKSKMSQQAKEITVGLQMKLGKTALNHRNVGRKPVSIY